MDAFALLKKDHQTVSGIFDELEAGDAAARRQTFPRLKRELELHAHVEETIFYPALKERPETRKLMPEAYAEHNEVKLMLAELEEQLDAAGEDEWLELLTELRENVEHHVEEEEGEMFSLAQKTLGQERIEQLGAQMQEAKQQPKSLGAQG